MDKKAIYFVIVCKDTNPPHTETKILLRMGFLPPFVVGVCVLPRPAITTVTVMEAAGPGLGSTELCSSQDQYRSN